jgi:hypothetical protein
LAIRRRILGEEHPRTLATMKHLADLYLSQRKYARAEALLTRILEVRRRVLGHTHGDTADALAFLGGLKLRQNRYAEAQPLLVDALSIYEKAMSETWRRYDSQSMLGASLLGQRQYAESEALLLAGYGGLLQRESTIPAPSRSAIKRAAESIIQLYEDWGKREKAAEWREKIQRRNTMSDTRERPFSLAHYMDNFGSGKMARLQLSGGGLPTG